MTEKPWDAATLLNGNDPYDALRGHRIPRVLKAHPRTRQLLIQLRKRSILDLGPLLGVTPFVMAKSGGSYLSAYARRAALGGSCEPVLAVAELLLSDPLVARVEGGGWGYEFDVQTRWGFYPAGAANLIATRFVGMGMFEASIVCDRTELAEVFRASAAFLLERMFNGEYFTYTESSRELVHNANLLGAALVGACGVIYEDHAMLDAALVAAASSVGAQRRDGSWPYGAGAHLQWCDNFHSAYNLDALHVLALATGEPWIRKALVEGVDFWCRAFFHSSGAPSYYAHGGPPYDIHSAATAVDVAARLAAFGYCPSELPKRVAAWTRKNLLDPVSGRTYYRRGRLITDRRHFVRWGDAHWACAEASLSLMESKVLPPLEAHLIDLRGRETT